MRLIANFTPGFISGDGIGNAARARVRALLRQGYEVVVVAHELEPWPEADPHLTCYATGSSWLDSTLELPIAISEKLQRADALVLDFGYYSPLNRYVTRLACPLLLSYHGMTPPHLIRDAVYEAGYYRAAGELLQLAPEVVISDSSIMYREFLGIGGQRSVPNHVIQLFGHTKRTDNQAPSTSGCHNLLCVGRFYPNKNLEVAIEAVKILTDRGIDVSLDLVGGGGDTIAQRYVEKLKELALPLGSRVRFLGRVTQTRLDDLYATCNAVVIPSLHEGFSLPAVEALIHGKQVFASNLGALPETLGGAGTLFDPFDPGELADLVASHSRADDEDRKRIVSLAWQRADQLSEDRFGEESIRVIEGVCQSRAVKLSDAKQHLADNQPTNRLVIENLKIEGETATGRITLRDSPPINATETSLRAAWVGNGLLLRSPVSPNSKWLKCDGFWTIDFAVPIACSSHPTELILSLQDTKRDVPLGQIRSCRVALTDYFSNSKDLSIDFQIDRLIAVLHETFASRRILVANGSGFVFRLKAKVANAILSLMQHLLLFPQLAFMQLLLQTIRENLKSNEK